MASHKSLPGFIADLSYFSREENGLATYQLRPSVKKKDEGNRLQVLTIGCVNEKPIHSILLLGETGTGKTRLINVLLNIIFGIQLEDSFRLELKDKQMLEGNTRKSTQSQTDYITAYIIYHQDGMMLDSNYVIIDTPGFNDTRGKHHQRKMMERLRMFLLDDFGIDSLSCIGLAMKANENRELMTQQEVLASITALLGNDVTSIIQLLATFATESTTVDTVARSAGIQFSCMHCFDNWPLYIPHQVNAEFTQRKRKILTFRWQNMADECSSFLDNVRHVKPVSLKKTRELIREKQNLEETLSVISSGVENVDSIIKEMKKRKVRQNQYEEIASQINWKKNISRTLRETYKVMKGYHVHNCNDCDQTCVFPCEDPTKIPRSLAGAAAGAAAVGAAAGAAAGPPGAAVGALLGGTGIGMGTFVLTNNECKYKNKKGVICCEDGCMHDISQHSIDVERIVKCQVEDEVIDYNEKRRYDEILLKIKDLREMMDLDKVYLQDATETLNASLQSLIIIAKRIEEMSMNPQLVGPLDLLDRLAAKAKDARHVEIYHMLRNAVNVMVNSPAITQDRSLLENLRDLDLTSE